MDSQRGCLRLFNPSGLTDCAGLQTPFPQIQRSQPGCNRRQDNPGMRINLTTPFAEKDQVKALGARWDSQKKVWYIKDVEDLTPFERWIPDTASASKPSTKSGTSNKPVDTSPPPPHCGCDVLPWEPCIHTRPVI